MRGYDEGNVYFDWAYLNSVYVQLRHIFAQHQIVQLTPDLRAGGGAEGGGTGREMIGGQRGGRVGWDGRDV